MKRAAVKEPKSKPKRFEELRPEVTPKLLAEMTKRIVEAFHPYKIILFGSYAYGKPHLYSDIDLFIKRYWRKVRFYTRVSLLNDWVDKAEADFKSAVDLNRRRKDPVYALSVTCVNSARKSILRRILLCKG